MGGVHACEVVLNGVATGHSYMRGHVITVEIKVVHGCCSRFGCLVLQLMLVAGAHGVGKVQ